MADGGDGQDICTYFASFINQRQQVERLLNWLRESQTTCTDTNCFDSVSGFPGTEQGSALLPGGGSDEEYDCSESFDQNPLGLVIMTVFALLTFYAMYLNNNNTRQPDEAQPIKDPRSSSQGDDHNHHSRREGGYEDDHRPAL